ncbi:MAG TPA: PAS domain S-box protein, partial [Spirochaetia bacterium]|nr:PAS domain S-box protein [Spirochaetia bacterium]
ELPVRTVVIYGIFASLWILLSDRALLSISLDPDVFALLETLKGWLFVVVSSVLLFTVLTRHVVSRRKVEEERQRLAAAIEQSADVIVVTDAKGTIQYVNPAFESITGYEREEAIGQNPRILKSDKQDEAFYREFWETISNGRTWKGRIVNRKKDGSYFTEEAAVSPVLNQAGEIVNYVAAKRDITNELGLEAQLLQSQKLESLGTLSAGISHDFNNILAIILGYSTMIDTQELPRDEVERRFSAIAQAADRGANLVKQLMAFARKSDVSLEVQDLNRLVAEIGQMLRETFPRNLKINVETTEGLPKIRADAAQIHQVLLNLCINARDSMPDGGTITITTSVSELEAVRQRHHDAYAPGYVAVHIRDSGCGMDEPTRQRIFEPFFTTKISGKGTGLGLSVVYGIVRNHGGYIEVESRPGAGSHFTVYLPAMQ